MRRLARHTMPALLLAAALAALGCTGGSDDAATTATASLSPTATAVPRPSAVATATAAPTGTPTTTRSLTTSATGGGRISPLPGTYSNLDGDSVTVITARPDEGWRLTSWGGDYSSAGTATTCALTMSADRTASVTFERIVRTLTVTAGAGGTVTHDGAATIYHGDEVTLTAAWNDATHDFGGWGGDCSTVAATSSACVLTMDANKTVTATFTALPATRCATPAAADCIRAVYRGAPGDYAQVADIPTDVLLTAASDGRYYVGRGQQVTVVTAARLPAGYTRFWLDRDPGPTFGVPSPVSFSQLIKPVGTTYTFTVSEDRAAPTLITFDLKAARSHPVRPTHKPVLGDTVATTEFSVPTFRYNLLGTTGAAAAPGGYALLKIAGSTESAIDNFGFRAVRAAELHIHAVDADGTPRENFYQTVETGDVFDYQTNGSDCGFRFRVASVSAIAMDTPSFGIEFVNTYGQSCGDAVSNPAAAADVKFLWLVRPGYVADDGVRVFLPNEPTGQGTYRLPGGYQYLVDVPLGMQVIASAPYLVSSFSTIRSSTGVGVTLRDVETGARLFIDPLTGEVYFRDDPNQHLDPVANSIRLAE